jgi:hypothetical protein
MNIRTQVVRAFVAVRMLQVLPGKSRDRTTVCRTIDWSPAEVTEGRNTGTDAHALYEKLKVVLDLPSTAEDGRTDTYVLVVRNGCGPYWAVVTANVPTKRIGWWDAHLSTTSITYAMAFMDALAAYCKNPVSYNNDCATPTDTQGYSLRFNEVFQGTPYSEHTVHNSDGIYACAVIDWLAENWDSGEVGAVHGLPHVVDVTSVNHSNDFGRHPNSTGCALATYQRAQTLRRDSGSKIREGRYYLAVRSTSPAPLPAVQHLFFNWNDYKDNGTGALQERCKVKFNAALFRDYIFNVLLYAAA